MTKGDMSKDTMSKKKKSRSAKMKKNRRQDVMGAIANRDRLRAVFLFGRPQPFASMRNDLSFAAAHGGRKGRGRIVPAKLERSTGPRGMLAPACEWLEPES